MSFPDVYDQVVAKFVDRISLKAVKVNQAMSRDTTAFSASLYLDSRRVAVVTNSGSGGPHCYEPAKSTEDYNAWVRFEQEVRDFADSARPEGTHSFEAADWVVGEVLVRWEEAKACTRAIWFQYEGMGELAWYKVPVPPLAKIWQEKPDRAFELFTIASERPCGLFHDREGRLVRFRNDLALGIKQWRDPDTVDLAQAS